MKKATFKTGTGFSIELSGYRLEYRGVYDNLPLYEALDGEVTAIAIVDEPAIRVGAIANSASQTLSGPVMIPDLKIFRTRGPNGFEQCYWYFSKDTIRKYKESYKGKLKFGH